MNNTTYRDEFLTVVLAVLDGVTDKDFDNAIERADKLLTKVDKFVAAKQTPPAQTIALGDQDDAA